MVSALCSGVMSAATWDIDSLERKISMTARSAIEGVWQVGGEGGAIVNISSATGRPGIYDVTLLDSPDMAVKTGCIVGEIEQTGLADTWQARFLKSGAVGAPIKKSSTRDFIIRMTEDGHLRFSGFKKNKSISLWRWIPYLFRVTVIENDTRPGDVDGAVRLYPRPARPSGRIVL